MKQLLTILSIFFFAYSFGQTPYFFQRSSGVNTVQDVRLSAKDNFYVAYNATDTSLNGGVDTLGAMLHVRSGSLQGLWIRDSVSSGGHHWRKFAFTDLTYWTLNGTDLYANSTSYDIGIGTTSPLYKLHVVDGGEMYFDGTRLGLFDNSTRSNILIGTGTGTTLTSSTDNIFIGATAGRLVEGNENTAIGTAALLHAFGSRNTSIGYQTLFLTDSSDNTSVGDASGVATYGKQNTSIGSFSGNYITLNAANLNNSEIQVGTSNYSGATTAAFITANSLSVGVKYPFNIVFNGGIPSPYGIISNVYVTGTVADANTITLQGSVFTSQGSGTTTFTLYNKQDNAIAIGYNVQSDSTNQIKIGNSSNTILKVRNFIVDLTDVPATGEVLTWDGTKAIWDTIVGGGGGAYSFLSPLSESGGVVSIQNAAADGSTKGAASFTAADFNASSGNISIDYTNGQAASTTLKGFLTNTDWNTFNNKVSTGLITGSALTMATARILGRTTASTGAIEEITIGSGLSLSAGTLTATGSGGSVTNVSGVTANGFTWSIANPTTTPAITLTLQNATTAQSGQLTSTDWNTFNNKQANITGAATTITTSNLTSNRALISSATGKVDVSSVTNTELGYVSGVTSAIQTQLNNKAPLVSKTFQALGLSGSDISWVYTSGYNATYTITADRDILVSGDADGDYGTLIITQNGTGGWDLTVPNTDFLQDGINVVGQPFTIDLPDAANSVAIVSWVNHSGVRYWTFGYYHQ